MTVSSEFNVKDWNQTDLPGSRSGLPVMRVSAVFASEGVINGHFLVEYVMHYQRRADGDAEKGEARYGGVLCFEGDISGKTGSFALEDTGGYRDGTPASALRIIDYSGAGELAGIMGGGKYYAKNGKMVLELEYSFG